MVFVSVERHKEPMGRMPEGAARTFVERREISDGKFETEQEYAA
jgi:hypothetical protein